MEDITAFAEELELGMNPKLIKEKLAFEIVSRYHGEKAAKIAAEHFEKIFSKRELPVDLPEIRVSAKHILPVDLIMLSGVVSSKSEARRLVEQGGFDVDNKVYKDPKIMIDLNVGESVRVGKRHFFRVVL